MHINQVPFQGEGMAEPDGSDYILPGTPQPEML
jgi:hypothetical protein